MREIVDHRHATGGAYGFQPTLQSFKPAERRHGIFQANSESPCGRERGEGVRCIMASWQRQADIVTCPVGFEGEGHAFG